MLQLLTLLSLVTTASAWTTGSSVSSFAGSVLITAERPTQTCALLTMKKGKANVPPQMRGQYKQQKQMAAMREQMLAASKPGADGLPVFNLFVRTKKANVSNRKFCLWLHMEAFFFLLSVGSFAVSSLRLTPCSFLTMVAIYHVWNHVLHVCIDVVPLRQFQRRREIGRSGKELCGEGSLVGH